MSNQETIANLNMISVAFVEPVTKEQRKLIDDTFDNAIKALEQVSCGDAISRQAVQDYIAKYLSQYLYDDVREAVEVIDEYIGELPSVNPTMTITEFADKCRECGSRYGKRIKELESNQPKIGHWERTSCSWILKCSNCDNMPHRDEAKYYKYCPNCGARMVGEQESEDKG